jgi:putative ABC transport system permease protein
VIQSFIVAWKYVRYNRGKTAILVACIALITFLPLGLRVLVDESEEQLMARATDTPLVLGSRGSALDLVMNTLYFASRPPDELTLAASMALQETGLADAIPLYLRFAARGSPIVGTTLDYFDLRGLEVERGRPMALLGDCVLGASVAERLGLAPGDRVVSSPENLFDLAGAYPLAMNVVGVLGSAHSPDDLAVFVDLKTAWIIAGLGHGHQDLAGSRDPSLILSDEAGNLVASAKLREYTEIGAENLDSFHFHGDRSGFPITAVIAVPRDQKSRVLLLGRYESKAAGLQIVQPIGVVGGLLQDIFKVESLLEAGFLLVGLATLLAMVLVFVLSLRLRRREIETIFRIGCSRLTIVRLMGAEILIIVLLASGVTAAMVAAARSLGDELVRVLISW